MSHICSYCRDHLGWNLPLIRPRERRAPRRGDPPCPPIPRMLPLVASALRNARAPAMLITQDAILSWFREHLSWATDFDLATA